MFVCIQVCICIHMYVHIIICLRMISLMTRDAALVLGSLGVHICVYIYMYMHVCIYV